MWDLSLTIFRIKELKNLVIFKINIKLETNYKKNVREFEINLEL